MHYSKKNISNMIYWGLKNFEYCFYQSFASSELVSEHIEKVTSSRATFDAMPRVIYMYHTTKIHPGIVQLSCYR